MVFARSMSSVNIALPTMAKELSIESANLPWIVSAASLSTMCPVGGATLTDLSSVYPCLWWSPPSRRSASGPIWQEAGILRRHAMVDHLVARRLFREE